MNALEISANAVMTLSIWLAARNSVHTWSTGIAGCILFAAVFFHGQLYADATLQVFFIVTSCIGWWQWTHRGVTRLVIELPVTKATHAMLAAICLAAIVILACYGWLLHRFTNAYLPYVDSAVLALSLAAQLLLMRRKLETWYFWIAVNTISVGLFASRGLWITAALYAVYWANAWYGHWKWQRDRRDDPASYAYAT